MELSDRKWYGRRVSNARRDSYLKIVAKAINEIEESKFTHQYGYTTATTLKQNEI